jgi:DNA-binding PadR family transcriptional regulator
MIEHELLFLGLLKESPKHGYDIKIRIKKVLSIFAGVNLKSIYYPLQVFEKKGLVVKRIGKKSRRPQRFVYALTKRGEARFHELLSKSLLDFTRPQFSLDLSLYFLNYLKPTIARRRLHGRIFILNKVARGLKEMLKGFKKKDTPISLVRMLEHNLITLEAEKDFLESCIRTL